MSGSRAWPRARSRGRLALAALTTLATLALPAAAAAGGWALVRLDTLPTSVAAGERVTIGFTVLQHGRTPAGMDVLGEAPRLVATNVADRAAAPLTALGRPDGARGHYVVDVTFPTAGSWDWEIAPGWFEATTFAPLTVAPAPTAGPAEASPGAAAAGGGDTRTPAIAATGLAAVAVLLALAARRRAASVRGRAGAGAEATPAAR